MAEIKLTPAANHGSASQWGNTVLCWSCWALTVLLVVVPFGWIFFSLLFQGIGSINWNFLTSEPLDGGIGSVLVSSSLILTICLLAALPLGLLTAIWLSELAENYRTARTVVSRSLDLLAAVPSIVFGLFGTIFFCQTLGMGFSILAGGLTLALMVLPIIVTTVYAALRNVPPHLRTGAAALGISKATTIRTLLVPAAGQGVIVGTVLGIGRAMAETAALLHTSGNVGRMPESLFDSGRSLSVHIYHLATVELGGESNAAGSALMLMAFLITINLIASALGRYWLGNGLGRSWFLRGRSS